MNEAKVFKRVTVGIIFFWLFLFVFFPNLLVFFLSFMKRDMYEIYIASFTFENYLEIIDPVYFSVLVSSIKLAVITTLFCLLIAFPFAFLLARIKNNLKNILLILIIVPFWTSALIRTYAIKILLTSNGLVNTLLIKLGVINEPYHILYTQTAVIMGLVYTLLPFMILPLYAVMEKLDTRLIEAAQDLGASRIQIFCKVVIPLTIPGVLAGSLLVFLPALGLFYIPDILGGSKVLLIGNLIKSQFMDSMNWPFGSAVSMTLTILIGLLLLANYTSVRSVSKGQKHG